MIVANQLMLIKLQIESIESKLLKRIVYKNEQGAPHWAGAVDGDNRASRTHICNDITAVRSELLELSRLIKEGNV